MEKKVQDAYEKINDIPVYYKLIYILALIGLFVIFSLLWGRPFPQTIYMNNERVYYGGWIINHTFVVFLSIIVIWFLLYVWQVYITRKHMQCFSSLLQDDCDVEKCLTSTAYGVAYGKQLLSATGKKSVVTKSVLGVFENLHMVALSVAERYEEAIAYYDYEWISKKLRIPKTNYMIIKLKLAYAGKDIPSYESIYQKVYSQYQFKHLLKGQKAMLEGKYEEALRLFLQEKVKHMCDKTTLHYNIANCYEQLGLLSEAKSHYEFVKEHGNTMPIRDHAIAKLRTLYGK